jgi:uncharacterized protein (DUF362 family)
MSRLTREEKHLKTFLIASAFTYLVVGSAFAMVPAQVLGLLNALSTLLVPKLALAPVPSGRFWVSLSFSMMMTISALCFTAQANVRKNKGYVVPVLVAKAASVGSALVFLLWSERYFAHWAIVVVDGSLFWLTLFFFVRASRAFLREQTNLLHRSPVSYRNSGPTTVVALKGDEKLSLLDDVLAQTGFFDVLRARFEASGKTKDAFSIVIKPNFMFTHSKKDFSTYTDPELVEALIDKIAACGFSNISVVEAQSALGNYYTNRSVLEVARHVGYSTSKNYRIVDLTEEMVPFDYGGRLGRHFVGPTWRDADFRVSFAKNKTHVFCNYTLTLKNIYGTLPKQNKLKEYHFKREYDWPTIETLKCFPVHFGLVDAIWSADGQFGVIADPKPNLTKVIIGGESLIAVDWVGAKKMGLDPEDPQVGRFLPLALEVFGKPEIHCVGDMSEYANWQNVSQVFIRSLDLLEEAYAFSDWWFAGLSAMDPYFRFKRRTLPLMVLRRILAPIKRFLYRYDELR